MDYVICSRVISKAKRSYKYIYDLLMPLASNHTSHKVVKNRIILEEYETIADESIRTWINGLTYMGYRKDMECNEDPIFLKTCKKLANGKLIVSEKEDYNDYEGVTVIDKDEAIEEIRPPKITINQIGNNNQASTGNNSANKSF